MTKKDFETFMYIGAEKILICIFSKLDSKILYKKESKFLEFNDHIDEKKIIIKKNLKKIFLTKLNLTFFLLIKII